MRVDEALKRLGGVAGRATLIEATSRRAVDRAVRRGRVVRDAHGRYALPTADEARRAASRLSGVLGMRSAASYWGWEQKSPPTEPEVVVRRGRKLTVQQRHGVQVHWITVDAAHVHAGIVTDRETTLVHCLRSLPYDEALAIADSALRHRDIDRAGLIALAEAIRGPGSAQARKVARLAGPTRRQPVRVRAPGDCDECARAARRSPACHRYGPRQGDPGPRRRAPGHRAGSGFLLLAWHSALSPSGLPALQLARAPRLAGPPVRLGGRHVRPRLRARVPRIGGPARSSTHATLSLSTTRRLRRVCGRRNANWSAAQVRVRPG